MLIDCTDCKNKVSTTATMCPSCGSNVKKLLYKKKYGWLFKTIIALMAIIYILIMDR